MSWHSATSCSPIAIRRGTWRRRAGGQAASHSAAVGRSLERGKLGPLLEISDDPAAPDYGPYRSPSAGAAMLRAEAVDTPISIGSDLITVTVRGVFALR